MEMTEQGKAMAEVTFTITESTPSGNSYLKYWGGERARHCHGGHALLPGCSTLSHATPRQLLLTCGWAAVALKLNLSLVLQRARER